MTLGLIHITVVQAQQDITPPTLTLDSLDSYCYSVPLSDSLTLLHYANWGLQDYCFAKGVYKLSEDGSGVDFLAATLILDSTYMSAVQAIVKKHLASMAEPEMPYYYSPDMVTSAKVRYHDNRASLFEDVRMFEEAVEEYDAAIYWAERELELAPQVTSKSQLALMMANKGLMLALLKRDEEARQWLGKASTLIGK